MANISMRGGDLLPSTGTSSPVLPPRNTTWVASDMDETFLSPDHTVYEETRRVYRKLKTSKIPVIIATGRSLRALKRVLSIKSPDFLPEMEFFPGIYLNGTCVYGESEDDIIYAHKMDVDGLKSLINGYYKLVDKGEVAKCSVFIQHIGGSYVDNNNDYFIKHLDKWDEEVPEVVDKPITELLDQSDNFWSQVSIVGDPQHIEVIEAKLFKSPDTVKILEEKQLHVLRPIAPMLTIIPATESKAKALTKLVERYPHLKLDSVVTIGDGNNDIEMLKLSRYSIAMGQASEKVKSVAKHIAPTNSEKGWARSLEALVLSESDLLPMTFNSSPRPSKPIIWICTDVDGTFLCSDHTVSSRTAETYAEVKKKGINIVFATGRTLRATNDVLERKKDFKDKHATLYPGIYCNGAHVVAANPNSDPIVLKTLPIEAVKVFVAFAYAYFKSHPDQQAILMTHHSTGAFIDYDSEMWRTYRARYEEEKAEVLNAPIDTLLEGPHRDTILQVHCCGHDERVPAFKAALEADHETMRQLQDLGTYVVSGIPACATLVRTDVSKAEGIRQLARHYPEKYPLSGVLVIGDGGNDKEMLQLEEAAITIAMGQAPPWIKKLARIVAPTNAEEGWARVIEQYVLRN